MAREAVIQKVEGSVLRLTLNRPDVLNSINSEMATSLREAISRAAGDPAIRVVVLAAEGRAFCAGQDLAEVEALRKKQGRPDGSLDLGAIIESNYNPLVQAMRELEKPVVAVVQGVAAGAGATLALAADIVIASELASFMLAFSRVGLIPDGGGTFSLPRLVGLARATALSFLSEKLSASEAQQIGLIYKSVPAVVLEQEVARVVTQLATSATRGIGLTKRAFNQSYGSSLQEQLQLELELQREAGYTADFREGVSAFNERRTPNFSGT